MSYYIHGYKIDDVSFVDLHEKLKRIQNKARKIGHSFFNKAVMDKVCFHLDSHLVKTKMYSDYSPKMEEFSQPLHHVLESDIRQKEEDLKNGRRAPSISVELTCIVYPLSNTSFIMSVYTERDQYTKLFLEEGFADYHYQNSTDKPDKVSAREWGQRKKNWDKLVDSRTPAENGFSVTLVKQPSSYGTDIDEMMTQFPSKEDRSKSLFGILSYDIKRNKDGIPYKKMEWDEVMTQFHDHRFWVMDTEEGQKFRLDTLDEIKNIIPDSYSETQILGFERKKR